MYELQLQTQGLGTKAQRPGADEGSGLACLNMRRVSGDVALWAFGVARLPAEQSMLQTIHQGADSQYHRSQNGHSGKHAGGIENALRLGNHIADAPRRAQVLAHHYGDDRETDADDCPGGGDRKSTRLNSSHQIISYAVFCLKKKNT